jgi:Flp pilus assembly protein TadG
VVTFDLDQGRRKESLQQQQIANAVADAGQAAVAQQVLAQQLAAAFDPQAAAAQAAQLVGSNTGVIPGTVTIPFIPLSGAVGYEPVITVLPEGANFNAAVVVSADRRYVRYSVGFPGTMPLFSAVGPVYTFNMATGVNGVGQGGGSGGYSGQ